MKVGNILLVSAFFPPSIGGPATFIAAIGKEFEEKGYEVAYANLEPYKKFSRLTQTFLFLRDMWERIGDADRVLIADTWSVLIPAVWVCRLRNKKYTVRIGGDYVWEMYIARTKERLQLSAFYTVSRGLSYKERFSYFLIRKTLARAEMVIFNTNWQREIWEKPYNLEKTKTGVVQNSLVTGIVPYAWKNGMQKIMRCPVRASEFKNVKTLKKVWDTLSQDYPDVTLSFEYIHPEKRADILAQTYAVIQPSVSDVAPNLICESVASGCPFICTADTGIRELFPKGLGFYFETSDEDSIRQGLQMMLNESFHNEQVQKLAVCKISRTYEMLAEEYRQLWNKI